MMAGKLAGGLRGWKKLDDKIFILVLSVYDSIYYTRNRMNLKKKTETYF